MFKYMCIAVSIDESDADVFYTTQLHDSPADAVKGVYRSAKERYEDSQEADPEYAPEDSFEEYNGFTEGEVVDAFNEKALTGIGICGSASFWSTGDHGAIDFHLFRFEV